jgi:hypothetical protein
MATEGWAIGAPLAILGALAMLAGLVEWWRGRAAAGSERLLVPAACSLLVVAGGVGLGVGWPASPYLLALTLTALLGLGLRNAWELLLQMDGEPAAEAASPVRPASARRIGRAARR